MKVVFLDIDGVLNGHDWDEGAQSTRIQYRCIKHLNRIIKSTGCKFVLSSAWRYMCLRLKRNKPAAMTLKGFEYMMRTHGTCGFRLLGTTASDEDYGFGDPNDDRNDIRRGLQIKDWLQSNKELCIERFIAIDDENWGISQLGIPLIQTSPKWGLSRRTATEAIRLLQSRKK